MWVCNVGELSPGNKETEIGVLARILIYYSGGVKGCDFCQSRESADPCVQTLLAMQKFSPYRKGFYTLSRLFTTVCTLWKSSLED
jgi:hypothetical protein